MHIFHSSGIITCVHLGDGAVLNIVFILGFSFREIRIWGMTRQVKTYVIASYTLVQVHNYVNQLK